jgi:deoxyribodipyrimidine photo-lyase
VDAAMRQLNTTGYMHNRLRMIVASFLTKDLLIDWRWGEEYFKEKLIDYDFSANNGGWQWAASVGCDAQPWFRIFNPLLQSQKFDSDGKFIKKYVPELSEFDKKNIHEPHTKFTPKNYPKPIIDHAIQRQKALKMFENINDVAKKQH